MPADDRFREILKGSHEPAEPSAAQMEEARAALHHAYRSEERPRRRRWLRPSIGWAAAAATAVVVAVLTVPGSTPAVDANLEEIARVTRTLTAEELPAGAYVYVHWTSSVLTASELDDGSPEFLYLIPRTIDIWVQGSTAEHRTTIGTPVFFDPETEAAYYAANADAADRIGETFTERFGVIANGIDITAWSSDPSTLHDQIETELALNDSPERDASIETFMLVEELMDPTLNAPPDLRAALLEVLGSLDVETAETAEGMIVVSVEANEPGLGFVRRHLSFDGAGYLRESKTTVLEPAAGFAIPPRTVISHETWSQPSIVDAAGIFPNG